MSRQRIMWDLCCGLGGASAAFRDAGWRVITVDIDPLFKPDILCDLADLDVRGEERPDFVWASPPCVEFARRRFDPSIEPSLATVIQARRVIEQLRPRFWGMENVRLAVPFINRVLGPHRQTVGAYFLWGTFPQFLPQPVSSKGTARGPHWLRSAIRAKIPYSLSSDMERAVSYVLRAEESGGRPGRDLTPQLALSFPADRPASSTADRPALEPRAGTPSCSPTWPARSSAIVEATS